MERPSKILPDGHTINTYQHLMTRIDQKLIDAMIEATKKPLYRRLASPSWRSSAAFTLSPTLSLKGRGGERWRYRADYFYRRLQQS